MASLVNDDKQVPPIPDDGTEGGATPAVAATEQHGPLPEVAEDEVITPEQMPCTIVVTGLPVGDAPTTRTALDAACADFGTIQKTIFQQDGAQQHAVVVLDTQAAAMSAVTKLNGGEIMGATVSVVSASGLTPDVDTSAGSASSSTALTSGSSNSLFLKAKATTIGVTASALVLGERIVNKVKRVDEKAGISKTVQGAAEATSAKVAQLDSQLGISAGINTGIAQTTAAVKDIDEKYDISGRTTRAASDATKKANELASKAMENPHVKKGWGFMSRMAKSAVSVASRATASLVAETNDISKQATAQAAQRRGSAALSEGGEGAAAATASASDPGEEKSPGDE